MAIKIDNDASGILRGVPSRAADMGSGGGKERAVATAGGASAEVNLTRLTESIRQALQSSGADTSFNQQRVAELRDAIARGLYEVDLSATARAILALERDIHG